MTDLHKPLGQSDKSGSGQKARPAVVRLLWALGFVLLAGSIAYSFLSRNDTSTIVSLNNPVNEKPAEPQQQLKPVVTTPPVTPQPAPQTASQPQPVEPPAFKPRLKPQLERRTIGTPDPDLIEVSEFGALPKISASGLRPLDAYSQSPTTVGSVRIAIVLGGLGLSQTGTKHAIEKLPAGITLAFSPIGNSLQRWMKAARKEGHEVALQLPMEPRNYPNIDPGRNTLLSTASKGENLRNLRWSLGRMTNYPLVMNYLGANLTNKPEILEPIMHEIKARGLGWLDDGSAQASQSLDVAERIRLPNVAGSFVLDVQPEAAKINQNLKLLELFAKRRGYAVATGSAFPETVAQLAKWSAEAEKRGIQLVPVSNLLRDYSR